MDYIRPYIHEPAVRVFTGFKYSAITSKSEDKKTYNRKKAQEKVSLHIDNFLYHIKRKGIMLKNYGIENPACDVIAGEIRRYLRDNAPIRVSRSLRDVAYKVLQCKEAMLLQLGRDPTLEEIAKELDLPETEVSQALDAVCTPVSLHEPVYTDGGDPLTVMDQVRDPRNTEGAWMEKAMLRGAYSALGEREKEILSLRFYDGKTQMEVASALGISQAQVSRLEKNALKIMRTYLSA